MKDFFKIFSKNGKDKNKSLKDGSNLPLENPLNDKSISSGDSHRNESDTPIPQERNSRSTNKPVSTFTDDPSDFWNATVVDTKSNRSSQSYHEASSSTSLTDNPSDSNRSNNNYGTLNSTTSTTDPSSNRHYTNPPSNQGTQQNKANQQYDKAPSSQGSSHYAYLNQTNSNNYSNVPVSGQEGGNGYAYNTLNQQGKNSNNSTSNDVSQYVDLPISGPSQSSTADLNAQWYEYGLMQAFAQFQQQQWQSMWAQSNSMTPKEDLFNVLNRVESHVPDNIINITHPNGLQISTALKSGSNLEISPDGKISFTTTPQQNIEESTPKQSKLTRLTNFFNFAKKRKIGKRINKLFGLNESTNKAYESARSYQSYSKAEHGGEPQSYSKNAMQPAYGNAPRRENSRGNNDRSQHGFGYDGYGNNLMQPAYGSPNVGGYGAAYGGLSQQHGSNSGAQINGAQNSAQGYMNSHRAQVRRTNSRTRAPQRGQASLMQPSYGKSPGGPTW